MNRELKEGVIMMMWRALFGALPALRQMRSSQA
jgi:hypothetical protein